MPQSKPIGAPAVFRSRGRGISKTLLLLFWTLILWGTLLDLGAAWTAWSAGLPRAMEGLGNLSPLNVLCAAAALPTWVTVAWLIWLDRRRVND